MLKKSNRLASAICLLLAFVATHGYANEYDDVASMVRAGKGLEAMPRIDQFLQTRPRDVQMRFFRGVVQRETGRTAEALATFNEIVQDYPELPEPYNNLAVIYASLNELDKAKAALERALQNNPAYAIAYRNLGDVLVRQALEAYRRAQQLGADGFNLPTRIEALRALSPSTDLRK